MWYDFTFQCIPAIIQMENGPGNMCIPFSWIKKWLKQKIIKLYQIYQDAV